VGNMFDKDKFVFFGICTNSTLVSDESKTVCFDSGTVGPGGRVWKGAMSIEIAENGVYKPEQIA